LTSRIWYPVGLRDLLGGRSSASVWLLAVVAGAAGVASAIWYQGCGLLDIADGPLLWLAAIILIACEEWMFRGLLVDGVAAIGGKVHAAIASTLLFALYALHPIDVFVGALASVVRGFGGSVYVTVMLRLLVAIGWILVRLLGQ